MRKQKLRIRKTQKAGNLETKYNVDKFENEGTITYRISTLDGGGLWRF